MKIFVQNYRLAAKAAGQVPNEDLLQSIMQTLNAQNQP
jgi:hypothetical protein